MGILDNKLLVWDGQLGLRVREDGVLKYVEKAYDMSGQLNHLTQTTEASQPRIGGNIAPNEKLCLKNQNGEARYITHPEISFAADEAWSVTTVVNSNEFGNVEYAGKIGVSALSTAGGGFISLTSDSVVLSTCSSLRNITGKNSVITYVADGTGGLKVYVNGILIETFAALTDRTKMSFAAILYARNGTARNLTGTISHHSIQSGALTPTQVTAEYNMLRALYPEIPSVQIGTQTWATSNFEAVATPMGNVIQEMQDAANVEQVVNGTFDSNISGWQNISNNANNTFTWDATKQAGKLTTIEYPAYNYGAQSYSITTQLKPNNWVRFSYKIWLDGFVSGGASVSFRENGTISETILTIANQPQGQWVEYVVYKKMQSDLTMARLDFRLSNANVGAIMYFDNVSVQSVGWAGSQDLKTGLISQGETEAEADEAAAFWAYHNNDVDVGAWAGKIYNGAARDMILTDISAYNISNPDWGYHVATEAEWTALLTNEEVTLKKEGTNYWLTVGGTNTTKFTALGGASRNADGTFGTIKVYVDFWCADSDKVVRIYHDGTAAEIVAADLDEGAYIRLVKD